MTFDARVARVLIASPGDTGAARRTIREAAEDWNSLHSEQAGVILLPIMWERDATPEMGGRPQGIINHQLVDTADVLIGTFWTRLGTPTGEAESGTAEEIEECITAGKPVIIYFSDEPVALESVDQEEYARLTKFRKSLRDRGLQDTYSTETELYRKLQAALTRTMRDRFQVADATPGVEALPAEVAGAGPRAAPLARVEREREMSGMSKSGRPQYRTRERLLVENTGTAAAESLRVRLDTCSEDHEAPMIIDGDEPITRLMPGGSVEYLLVTHLGTARRWDVVFAWEEDGNTYEDRQSAG